mmetsp:Transcript_23039/g.65307  ORF Transcript_23039/g.65307 Transcript_23039/m.65307 type:complete len:80 (-) Transcript_23039:583-822(-)
MRQPRQEAATHEATVAVGASQQAHEFYLDAVDERAFNGAVNRWPSSRIQQKQEQQQQSSFTMLSYYRERRLMMIDFMIA